MRISSPVSDRQVETIAELRQLYRGSEARASRLRLLSASGRAMAEASDDKIEEVLEHIAVQLAYFVGHTRATVSLDPQAKGIAIPAPGQQAHIVGHIDIDGLSSPNDIVDSDDRETFQMHLEMIGATIDRIHRERERTTLLNTLHEREQRLEYLVGRIFSAQEDERRRVSHDLHDGVAQTATALARMLEGGGLTSNADIPAADRAKLAAIARDLVTELRAVIAGLRPPLLDDLGLEAAIRSLGDVLSSDGFIVDMRIKCSSCPQPANTETALFRVAQEAVTNIRKHAGHGCRVHISFTSAQDGSLRLHIEDFGNGCSFAPDQGPQDGLGAHVGIDVMRERMAAVGGRLIWKAMLGRGVKVIAECDGTT